MDINQLRYFIEICKHGSMSKAAAALYISPQGISAAIRRLEDELGADLFFRTSNGLSLTNFGTSVLTEAQTVIEHVDKISQLGKLAATGKASITVSISTGRFMKLPASLQKLLLTPPDEFSVTLVNDYSTVCADMVLKEQASFAMVYGEYSKQKFDVTLLENVEQVFIVSKNHPFARRENVWLRELDNVPLLMPDLKTVPGMYIAEAFSKAGIRLNLAYVCMTPHQAIDIAAKNDSIVARTLKSDLTADDLRIVNVVKIEDFQMITPFSLISKKGRKLSVYEQLFQHLIFDCYRHTQDMPDSE